MRGLRFIGVFVVMSLLAASAQASMIGINFEGNGGSVLASTDSAGVVAQTNWNGVAGGSGSLSGLVDDGGTATTASVTFTGHNGGAAEANVPSNNDEALCDGFIYSYWNTSSQPGGAVQGAVTVSNIPTAYQSTGYEVYIYVTSNRTDYSNQMITVNLTNYYASLTPYSNPSDPGNLVYTEVTQTTSTTGYDGTPYGSYVHITGLTGSSFSFTFETDPNVPYVTTPGVYGLQIVQTIPEPATMSLIGIGGLGLLLRRKR